MENRTTRNFILLLAAMGTVSITCLAWLFLRGASPDYDGGTRLRYTLEVEEALATGDLDEAEAAQRGQLLEQTIAILRERLDPAIKIFGRRAGLARVFAEDGRYVVIELPQPPRGRSEKEWVASARGLIQTMGRLEFLLEANPAEIPEDVDLTAEREKARQWLATNSGQSIDAYNRLPHDAGGPAEPLRWYPRRTTGEGGEVLANSAADRLVALVASSGSERFNGMDLQRVERTQDLYGYPAVGLELRNERASDFGDWTEANAGRAMAIVLDEEVVTLATIRQRLPRKFIIEGGATGFTPEEVNGHVRVLRAGSLPVRLRFLDRQKIRGDGVDQKP